MNQLDEKDLRILEILKNHAEYSTRQISKKLLLPITTIHNRIQRLKKEKVIQKFTIEADYAKLERNFVSYVMISVDLQLLKQKKKTQYDITRELQSFAFVERVDIVAGGADLVAIVRVKNVEEFDAFLIGKLQLIEGIKKTQ